MQLKLNTNTESTNEEVQNTPYDSTQDDIANLSRRTLSIEELLVFATEHNCSDLYIKVFDYPYISRYGKIVRLPCTPINKDMWSIFYEKYILNELNAGYVRDKLLDTSVAIRIPEESPNFGIYPENYYRYRTSFGFSQERNIATFRMIKPERITFDNINYNEKCMVALHEAFSKKTGITVLTGPTGSGKSTTLSACINTFIRPGGILNDKVIITLEDPIENLFDSTDNVKIHQKELGVDFRTFALGIKAALREHPNIIMVGEMRDKEVICAGVEAARTGHGVYSTFHADDVGGTVSRLCYHLDNDKNLTFDLILQVNLILSQRMLKRDDKYVVDTQYLLLTQEVRKHLIEIIENPNLNIAVEVKKLVARPELQEAGISKDWDYPDEV